MIPEYNEIVYYTENTENTEYFEYTQTIEYFHFIRKNMQFSWKLKRQRYEDLCSLFQSKYKGVVLYFYKMPPSLSGFWSNILKKKIGKRRY